MNSPNLKIVQEDGFVLSVVEQMHLGREVVIVVIIIILHLIMCLIFQLILRHIIMK